MSQPREADGTATLAADDLELQALFTPRKLNAREGPCTSIRTWIYAWRVRWI